MKEKVASLSHLMERLWWGTLDPTSASLGSRDKGYSELGAGHSPPHFLPHGWWGRFVFLKDWAISPADRYNTQWSCSIRGDVVSGGCPGQLKMARVGDTSRLVLFHSLLQGIFPAQGWSLWQDGALASSALQADSLPLNSPGSLLLALNFNKSFIF